MILKNWIFDIEWEKVYVKNDFWFVAEDFNPVSKWHCILVPYEHIVSFFDIDDLQIKKINQLIKLAKNYLDQKYSPDWYNIWINEWKYAGRTIDHLHIHIIPRYQWDVVNPIGWVRNIFPEKWDYTSSK